MNIMTDSIPLGWDLISKIVFSVKEENRIQIRIYFQQK